MQMPSNREDTKKECLDWLEKQKEQKLNPSNSVGLEQKPAEWSDTDKIGWDEAFACVTRAEKAAKNEEELQNAVTAEKWLKEIKFKYCVHPVNQEWSEEDEHRCGDAIYFLETAKTHYADTSELEKCIEWLKGLQPTEGIKENLEEIPSNVDLDKAAEEYALSLSKSSMGGKEYCKQDFKAGAEWQKKQDEDGKALLYVNDHAYKKGFKDGKIEAMLNNELIWQDVKQIVNIADKEIEGLYRHFDKFPTEQSYYKEILKKYKEQKNK